MIAVTLPHISPKTYRDHESQAPITWDLGGHLDQVRILVRVRS